MLNVTDYFIIALSLLAIYFFRQLLNSEPPVFNVYRKPSTFYIPKLSLIYIILQIRKVSNIPIQIQKKIIFNLAQTTFKKWNSPRWIGITSRAIQWQKGMFCIFSTTALINKKKTLILGRRWRIFCRWK